jgi:uncharacterized protein (TIGR00661 family)
MKVLYAIQGTGNGHLSRANDIIPILKEMADVDVLISGIQSDVSIPFHIKYRLNGLSFIFGKNGGVNLWETIKSFRLYRLIKDIMTLPIRDYDLIINDFEPVSAWAAKLKNVPSVSLSHQAAVANEKSPKPEKRSKWGDLLLKKYAPSKQSYGFHFEKYEDNIFTPVIRKQIRELEVTNRGHFTVYLPAYGVDLLIKSLSQVENANWVVFSKFCNSEFQHKNVRIKPINNESFIKSLASCAGVLCGAGFETPAEALFMNKKLMVVPMSNQYEQQCNAMSLKKMGVPVLKGLDDRSVVKIQKWINETRNIKVNYPDITKEIIGEVIRNL